MTVKIDQEIIGEDPDLEVEDRHRETEDRGREGKHRYYCKAISARFNQLNCKHGLCFAFKALINAII